MASPESLNSAPAATRVCIVQQIVPHYRAPAFNLLARQPGIQLSVWSDMRTPFRGLKHAPGAGDYEEVHASFRKVGPAYWQPGQMRAAREAVQGRFDVIIFSWNTRLVHLPMALRAARRAGVPTLLWGHGYSKDESAWRRHRRNSLLRLSAGCIVYNHTAAERLVSEGMARERIFVGLNAIDQAPIRAAREHWLRRPDELARFRAKHGLQDPADVILFISRLEPDKRVDLLLDAFMQVVQQRPRAKLVLIGRGREEERLRAHADALGIAPRVIFAGAVYDEMHLAPWFLSSACLAYPVAIGLSILHAFGYGLPVVTSDDIASHNPEIEALRDGDNGLLYRDGDAGDFAAKMLSCMTDPAMRQRMSEAALHTVREPDGFCLPRMVQGFVDAVMFAVREGRQRAAPNRAR